MSRAADLWAGYSQHFTEPQITGTYFCNPYYARQTPAGHLAVGIIDGECSLPCNLMIATVDGARRYLHPVVDGQHAPCSNYIGATSVIVAQSYLSGLALAHRYPERYVVSALEADNIEPCIFLIASWWSVQISVAPDDPKMRFDGLRILRPPAPRLTWAELHKWEVENQCHKAA